MQDPKHILSGTAVAVMLIVIACGILIILAEEAYPHGDASWIEDTYPACCGVQDCEPVSRTAVYRSKAGWQVDGLDGVVSPGEVKPSIDERPWACRYELYDTIRCLFLPKPTPRM